MSSNSSSASNTSPAPPQWNPTPFEVSVYTFLNNIVLQVICNAVACLFLLAIFLPLCALARTRSAVQIICSKAVAAFLINLAYLVNGVYHLATQRALPSLWNGSLVHILFFNYSAMFHVLMLALNRAHSVFFPFHYTALIQNRLALKQCAIAWLSALALTLVTVVWTAHNGLRQASDVLFNPINLNVSQWGIYAAILLYLALLVKLAWHKYFIRKMTGLCTETGHLVSTAACLAGICPFLLMALNFFLQYSPIFYSEEWFRVGTFIVVFICQNCLVSYSEEICLLVICADFRKIVRVKWLSLCTHKNVTNQQLQLSATTNVVVKRNNFVEK